MNVQYINPFIESVSELFTTMFQKSATRGNIGTSKSVGENQDVVAMIGITGDVQGSVAVAMSEQTALKVVGSLLGCDIDEFGSDATDGVAEVVNMIAGGAKAKLPSQGLSPLQLSLPTVLRGKDFVVTYPTQSLWLDIPFESELGSFHLRVTLKNAQNN